MGDETIRTLILYPARDADSPVDRVRLNQLGLAFDSGWLKTMNPEVAAHHAKCTLANHNHARLSNLFQAAGNVDGIADHRIFVARADVSRKDQAAVDTHT